MAKGRKIAMMRERREQAYVEGLLHRSRRGITEPAKGYHKPGSCNLRKGNASKMR